MTEASHTTPDVDVDVDVDDSEALRANRANWDDRADIHAAAAGYDVEGFVADRSRISGVIRDDLAHLARHLPDGGVAGLDVLHLQCHIGTDTLSLARLGARVTGLDQSPRSLEVARDLARRCGIDATFVEGDARHAADVVPGTFDHVHTSIGTVVWLPDLGDWARSIARLLRPGGTFFIRDGHPALMTLDDARTDELVVRYRYFPTGQAQSWAETTSYTGEGRISEQNARSYEWPHPLSEIIGALLGAGLRLVAFDEQQVVPWQAHRLMAEVDGGYAFPEHLRDRVPATYTITATKDEV